VRGGLFDAGRIVPEGQRERFRVLQGARPATVVVRTTPGAGVVVIETRGARTPMVQLPFGPWMLLVARLEGGVSPEEAIALHAARGEYRDFHVWVARDAVTR
jgi:hypothetical protein